MSVQTILRTPKRSCKSLRRFLGIMRVFKPAARPSRRQASPRLTAPVTVWDAKLGAFRSVNLYNFHDPLWEAAKELAIQSKLAEQAGPGQFNPAGDRPAPQTGTRGRAASDVPRSPFGGSNHVAGDLHDVNKEDCEAVA